MIHQTTEADISASVFDDVLVGEVKTDGEVCDEKGAAGEDIEGEKVAKKKRKPRKSNVARPESEANSIEVVEVQEEEIPPTATEVPKNKEKSKSEKKTVR